MTPDHRCPRLGVGDGRRRLCSGAHDEFVGATNQPRAAIRLKRLELAEDLMVR